jgi:hypothetical protein
MYARREWFEGYKVAYTGADLISMARMVMEREPEHGDAVKRAAWERALGMEPARLPRSMAEKVNPRQLVWRSENLFRLIEASLASHPFPCRRSFGVVGRTIMAIERSEFFIGYCWPSRSHLTEPFNPGFTILTFETGRLPDQKQAITRKEDVRSFL